MAENEKQAPKDKKPRKERQYGMNVEGAVPDMMEPHQSIKYVGRLFKILAVLIFLLLVTEIALGVAQDGLEALPLLLLEVAQLLVIAGLLWGGGDLTYLIVETNKDLRASRVLLWQMSQLMQMQMASSGVQVAAVDPENPVEDD